MKRLRIGSVPYLNAWPLIWPLLEGRSPDDATLVLAEPRLLRNKLRSGAVDAALLSSVEYLADPRRFSYAPGFGVCSRGPVDSVKLLLRRAPEEVKTLALDPHSLTANLLARAILELKYKAHPRRVRYDGTPAGWRRSKADAGVVIGDRALSFPETRHLDLGTEWTRWTGLPFVYALWIHRRRHPGLRTLYRVLARAAGAGLRARRDIARRAARQMKLDPDACLRYLTVNIRYRIGPPERRALREFSKCLRRLKR